MFCQHCLPRCCSVAWQSNKGDEGFTEYLTDQRPGHHGIIWKDRMARLLKGPQVRHSHHQNRELGSYA